MVQLCNQAYIFHHFHQIICSVAVENCHLFLDTKLTSTYTYRGITKALKHKLASEFCAWTPTLIKKNITHILCKNNHNGHSQIILRDF